MEDRRLAAIPFFKRGDSLSSIARRFRVSRQAVSVWHQQFRRHGRVGLRRRQRPGRPPKLTPAQIGEILRWLTRNAPTFILYWEPNLTAQEISERISHRFRVSYHPEHVCRLLSRFGFVYNRHPDRGYNGCEPIEFRGLVNVIRDCLIKRPNRSDLEEGRGALKRAGTRLGYELGEGSNGVDLYWLVHGKRQFAWQVHDERRIDKGRSKELRKAKGLFRLMLQLGDTNSYTFFCITTFPDEKRRFSDLRAELAIHLPLKRHQW